MKIAVIGGGASGLFVASQLRGCDVTIFDGNEKCGKKLYITGKGRCNLTNNCDKETFLSNVVNGENFIQSAISRFLPINTIEFFEGLGLPLKTERGGRVFPVSDKSSDVIKTLEKACKGTAIKLNEKVLALSLASTGGFKVKTTCGEYRFDKVIIATGGKSYCATGSTGDGYKFAKMLGHSIIEPKPALAAIKLKESVKAMQGLPLKNVSLLALADGKKYSQFGEMLFTDEGITGPIVLTMSSYINRAKKVELYLDLKPALTPQQLDNRLLREFDEGKNKDLFNVMRTLLPKNFIEFFLYKLSLSPHRKINSVTLAEREKIVNGLKHFPLAYKELYPLDSGIITSGGVNLKEVNPSTMESKLCKGLYFVGEVLDIDCLTGGFNLQTAFATAYACSEAIKKEEKNGI